MQHDGLQKAQEAIEIKLREEGQPMKARLLLTSIRKDRTDMRDIDLREAVWILIGRGKLSLTANRELTLSTGTESTQLVN